MNKWFENEKFTFFIGGAAAALIGLKALKTKTARKLAVNALATGMKLQEDARVSYENIREDAADLCYEAKMEAAAQKEAKN